MEGCAEGEAKGSVHTRNSSGTGHPQGHCEKVYERQKPAHYQTSTHIQGFVIWYDQEPSW